MKTPSSRQGRPGYVSYALVLSTGMILTAMTVMSYRRAMTAHQVQGKIQLRTDYAEKEDTILRAIVAITPNRAIRAMQSGSNANATSRDPLSWQNILTEALDLANARTSVSGELRTAMGITNLRSGNAGDSALATPSTIFRALNNEGGFVSAGINRNLGSGFPPPLSTSNTTTTARDPLYPIITRDKLHGTLASGRVGLPVDTYPDFNLLTYPQINFGYARPGDPIVAKRHWWAFRMNVAAQDQATTRVASPPRDFVLSIYEIPSQLAISAAAFMSLGRFATGESWQFVNIEGGVFAGKAIVEDSTALPALASRRGMTLSSTATVGGENFARDPFTPGDRETYQLTRGNFFPVSLASESGRVAFVPINRGAEFFDRFAHSAESNTVSPATWNQYSVGALQCAMQVDITRVQSSTNKTPTALRFSYLRNGTRQSYIEPLVTGIKSGLPPGYVEVCDENESYNFGTAIVDVAYGMNGKYYFQTDVTGTIPFTNSRFGDPIVGTFKAGYYRPSAPYKIRQLPSGKTCVAIYPQRFPAFLNLIGADSTAVNHSLVVNVDYSTTGLNNIAYKPAIPCLESDYGLIVQECANLTPFTSGFSIVTNLRTYIGSNFNVVEATPPAGYTPSGPYYPPVSLFCPEKRYGVEYDPFAVSVAGQLGSLASDTEANPVRPLDSKNVSGQAMEAGRISVNLRPIRHPAELPPITMMNWLVVLEERRTEFASN